MATGEAGGAMVPQFVVARHLGVRWNVARKLLQSLGVPVHQTGPRQWFVAAADWQQAQARLAPKAQAVAS